MHATPWVWGDQCMPYPVKCFFFAIYEDMVQILLMLKVLFTQDSEVEALFCEASPGSEPSLLLGNNLFSLGLSLFKVIFSMTLLG